MLRDGSVAPHQCPRSRTVPPPRNPAPLPPAALPGVEDGDGALGEDAADDDGLPQRAGPRLAQGNEDACGGGRVRHCRPQPQQGELQDTRLSPFCLRTHLTLQNNSSSTSYYRGCSISLPCIQLRTPTGCWRRQRSGVRQLTASINLRKIPYIWHLRSLTVLTPPWGCLEAALPTRASL